MNLKSKVWVIDPAASRERTGRPGRKLSERREYTPDEEAPAPKVRVRRETKRVEEEGSPLLALVAYLAGPYSILTTHRGRESRFWVSLAIVSSILTVIIILRAKAIFQGPQGIGIGLLVWLSITCITAIAAFASWARGVLLLGLRKGWLLQRLPAWIRHPLAAGLLGLVIPGFGLFIARHPRRAAYMLLTVCAAGISALVLAQAPTLWRLSRTAGPLVGHGDLLERVFLVAAAIGLFGAFAWIVQALDGARLAGYRMEDTPQPHGDWAAAALVVAIAALFITFKPSHVAVTLDHFAVSMRGDGLRVIPLCASYAAMRLDPSEPFYTVQAIGINEALGRKDAAAALRRELAERWKPYERMLRIEASFGDNAIAGPPGP